MQPPIAKISPYPIIRHGHYRQDNYRWLRDDNWQEICAGNLSFSNPDIRAYIDEENAYTSHVMTGTEGLQTSLYDEMISRLKEDDDSVPTQKGPYFYYTRTEKGKNYPIFCRKMASSLDDLNGVPEEIYLDVNAEAKDHEQYLLKNASVSPNHNLLAYLFNLSGSMSCTLRVRNLETNKDLLWDLPNITSSIEWNNDSKHLYYVTRHPKNGRGFEVYCLDIMQGPLSARLIFTKPERCSHMFISLNKSNSEKFIEIHVNDHSCGEIHLLDADNPKSNPSLIAITNDNVTYDVAHLDDKLFILTNIDDATNFKIMVAPASSPTKENWQEYIPHHANNFISNFNVYKTNHGDPFLIYEITRNDVALPAIIFHHLNSQKEYALDFPDEAYDISFIGSAEFICDKVRYTYQSPTQPQQTVELDLNNLSSGLGMKTNILKTKEVPNYDPSLYQTKRIFAEGHDGAKIPITLMYKRGIQFGPAYVYGYGSYGLGMSSYFSPNRVSLLDRGILFAITHIRGGDDKGYGWYLDGKLNKKKNSFLDYISCCEHLIKEGYATKGKLAAAGGSAGGMLVGAVANMRPDLFCTVVADVPFVDVLNTMEDTDLPLTEAEWNEWGNPLESKDAFEYILSYAPYENVRQQNYPHMLFNSGISDEQVTYWEPTKMVAKLRAHKTDQNLLLLKMQMTSGHSGASKRYESYKELAFEFAFILKTLDIQNT